MWDVQAIGCSGFGMFAIRNIRDAQCSSMFSMREVGMLDVREVGCWRCWVLGMWNVGMWYFGDAVCWGCKIFWMWNVGDMVYSGCGIWDICCDVGCRFTKCLSRTVLSLLL